MIRVDSRSFAVKAILVAALPRWVIRGQNSAQSALKNNLLTRSSL
jgi:hypothetical protein